MDIVFKGLFKSGFRFFHESRRCSSRIIVNQSSWTEDPKGKTFLRCGRAQWSRKERSEDSDSKEKNGQFSKGGHFPSSWRFLLYCGLTEAAFLSQPVQTPEEKKKERKEDMILDIKRAILFLRDGDFRKAENILHVALGKAREMQDPQGEVYILDLLANLYYEEKQYDKAEATFKEVLRRELTAGKPEDTEAIVEISAKLARMYAETRQFDKARAGFDFCLEKLEKKLETMSAEKKEEVVDLFFKVLQWGSEFLMNVEDKADDALVEATELIESGLAKARRLEQTGSAAYQTLANNLSTLYTWQNRMDEAVAIMKETIKLAVASEHWSLSHFYLNLAHIYAENGDLKNAEITAEKAMEVAKKAQDPAVEAEVKRLQDALKKRFLEAK